MKRLAFFLPLFIIVTLCNAQNTKWTEGRELTVEGRSGNGEREHFYDRMPVAVKDSTRKEVWELSQHSAGLCVRFSTNSQNLSVRWTLRFKQNMPHLTSCVTNGIDLYALDEESGQWLWAGIVKSYNTDDNKGNLLKGLDKKMRHYMLYLPMYNGVDSVFIGTDSIADIKPLVRRSAKPPIVFYGTSIMQGASASRAGLAATAILGRFFDIETVNLGFSGNARMEEVIGRVMLSTNASCYVVDCLPNMTKEMLREWTLPFLRLLKTGSPSMPIVLVECPQNDAGWINTQERDRIAEKNKTLRKLYSQLITEGYTDLYYVPSNELTGHDYEATIDGTHFNDLGFMRYADRLKPVLARIIAKSQDTVMSGKVETSPIGLFGK